MIQALILKSRHSQIDYKSKTQLFTAYYYKNKMIQKG